MDTTVVDVEISLNDENRLKTADRQLCCFRPARIKVCVLEDIVAEKLLALLQQKHRNRTSSARRIRPSPSNEGPRRVPLDFAKVADYLLRKSKARGIEASKGAFDDEIRTRAGDRIQPLATATQSPLIPFEEAWRTVLHLVGISDIPE